MTKTRSTKRALVLSALAILMCVSMLVGSTFAWFTDTVTSARNQIVSGNLDIKLEYSTFDGTNWSAYDEVDANTKIFNENALYEPGYTEVVRFKVTNAGSLALKYNMTATVYKETAGINVNNEPFNLSDYIYTGKVDRDDVNDRETAAAKATTKLGTGLNVAAGDHMLPGDVEEFALVLTMPTTVGNEANHLEGHQPSIEFGIVLVATQYTHEKDDFGPDYDEDATYPTNIQISTPVADANDDGLVDSNINITYTDDASSVSNVSAVVPAGTKLEAGATELVLKIEEQEAANPNVTISSTQTATTYEITLEGVDATNTEAITVTLVIEKGLSGVELYHNNTKIDSTYDVATGELTFATTGFSPFTVVHSPKGVTVATAEELVAAVANGGVIKMANDITLAKTLVITKTTVLDGNGYTLTYTGAGSSARAINVNGASGVAIQNLTIKADSAERAINIIQNATNVTIDNVTATAANYTVNVASSAPNAVVTIKNSTITGLCTVNVTAAGAAVAVNNSTINCVDNNTTVGESYAALSLNADAVAGKIIATDSTINVTEGSDSSKGRNAAEDGVVTINGSDDEVRVLVAAITYGTSPYYYTFASVAAAVEFAKNGDTITLIRDVELNETVFINAVKTITLDLNGKTITAPASGNMFHSGSDTKPSITITSSVAGAEINVTGGDTAVVLGYGSTVISNVTINVVGCDNSSPNPFKVFGDLTLGEGTVVNVDYLGTALISNNGAHAIVIDGAQINIGTFKTNGTAIITLNTASTLEIKDTDIKVDTFVLSAFGGDSLVSKVDGVTVDGCTFDVTDSNGASCTFEAKDGKYRLVQE